MERTEAYRFTITSLDDPRLAELKSAVKAQGGLRVTLRARLGRNNPDAEFLTNRRRGSYAGPQMIPIAFGTRWDVYVHTRSPGQSYAERKARKAEAEAWQNMVAGTYVDPDELEHRAAEATSIATVAQEVRSYLDEVLGIMINEASIPRDRAEPALWSILKNESIRIETRLAALK